MKFRACGCDPAYLKRRQRVWWMRLVWTRRLYRCQDCQQLMFIPLIGEQPETTASPTDEDPQGKPQLR